MIQKDVQRSNFNWFSGALSQFATMGSFYIIHALRETR
jgi:hypothetical protein